MYRETRILYIHSDIRFMSLSVYTGTHSSKIHEVTYCIQREYHPIYMSLIAFRKKKITADALIYSVYTENISPKICRVYSLYSEKITSDIVITRDNQVYLSYTKKISPGVFKSKENITRHT